MKLCRHSDLMNDEKQIGSARVAKLMQGTGLQMLRAITEKIFGTGRDRGADPITPFTNHSGH